MEQTKGYKNGWLYRSPFGIGFVGQWSTSETCWYEYNAFGKVTGSITGRLGEYLKWLLDEGILKLAQIRTW